MKTTILILLGTVSIARATLIDLTPGGFDVTQPLPGPFLGMISQVVQNQISFFDAASPSGWTNTGILNGGTFFQTSLIGDPGATSAGVGWDFTSLPGWSMRMLLVEGDHFANLYFVPRNFNITDLGEQVTLHNGMGIGFISFYGRTPNSPVPDTGNTLLLMGVGFIALLGVRHCAI